MEEMVRELQLGCDDASKNYSMADRRLFHFARLEREYRRQS